MRKTHLKSSARALLTAALLASAAAQADITLRDEAGGEVRLAAPAQRIVSLAPHATEMLYAIGAGARLVGTVAHSDYPAAARALPQVGGYDRFDPEAVVALQPDLVVGWESGNLPASLAKLRRLGVPVYLTQPNRIADIATSLENLGRLVGGEAAANAVATAFRQRLAQLTARYAQRPPLRVFYQVWKQPLMTINDKQIIGDAIHLCGGRNVFGALPILAPTVTVEGVLAANPEVIVASGMGEQRPEWLDDWRRWPSLTAVARDNLYFIPPDLIQRHTPRILDGAEILCRQLEAARAKLGVK